MRSAHRRITPTSSAATASAWKSPRRSELRFDALAEALEGLDAREELVVRGDDGPRRVVGRGALDHVVHRALVRRPLLAVAPVLVRDLEALVGRVLPRLEAPQLLRGGDREPEFRDDG